MKRQLSHFAVQAVKAEDFTFDVAASQLDRRQTTARLRKLLRVRKSTSEEG